MKNAHAILGISPNASLEEIRQAYIMRTRIVHPDRFEINTSDWRNANNMLRELNEAYSYLKKNHRNQPQTHQKNESVQPTETNTQQKSPVPPPEEKQKNEHQWKDPNFKPYKPGSGYRYIAQDQRKDLSLPHLIVIAVAALFFFCFTLFQSDKRSGAASTDPGGASAAPSNASPQTFPQSPQKAEKETDSDNLAPSRQVAAERSAALGIEEPEIKLPPERPIPESGTFWNFTDREEEAPFTIKTNGTGFYFVKLVTLKNETAVAFFVHAGDTIDFDVPLGVYRMRYASGEKWYGEEELFGPDTACYKSDNTFDFSLNGNQFSGYTITLYKVPGGNMQTDNIPRSEF